MDNFTATISCPEPFINPLQLDSNHGYIKGRLCHDISDDFKCCLPCPMTDWVYSDEFNRNIDIAGWVAVVASVLCVLLSLSWLFLPVKQTSRHYLSVCLTCSIILLNLGFIIPLAAKPDQCYDSITPNDMKTSPICAVTGACVHFGGWAGVMWLFLRSLSLHLQICWNVPDNRTFKLCAFAAGWGIPIIGGILVFVINGVSYRFGSTCYTNHTYSMEVFWIPLLVFIGMAVIIAFATLGYCIKVYVAVLNDPGPPGMSVSTFATHMGPKQLYRRIRHVVCLQWRGIAVVSVILATIVFYAVVFAFSDNVVRNITHNPNVADDWAVCLLASGGDKNKCLPDVSQYVLSEKVLIAVTILLASNGVWLFVFLGRWSMVQGWLQLLKSIRLKMPHRPADEEEVCSEANTDSRSYKVLSKGSSITYYHA